MVNTKQYRLYLSEENGKEILKYLRIKSAMVEKPIYQIVESIFFKHMEKSDIAKNLIENKGN
jgi:hypothetical protein